MTVEELRALPEDALAAHQGGAAGRAVRAASRCGGWRSPSRTAGCGSLGIPTVVDRLIQQALHQVLQPLFDPDFSESSYGFRPGRSAHQAVQQARAYVAEGRRWVVDMDLEKFFDRVNHDVLMARVARKVKDKRVLRLIRRYLQAGMMDGRAGDGRGRKARRKAARCRRCCRTSCWTIWTRSWSGGGTASAAMPTTATSTCGRRRAGERVMASVTRFLEKRLKLKVNAAKSAVDRPWERKFLGYTMTFAQKPTLEGGAPSR